MDQLSIQDLLDIAERHKKNQASVLKAVKKYNNKKRLEKVLALGYASVEDWKQRGEKRGRKKIVVDDKEVERKKILKSALKAEAKNKGEVDLTSILSAMTLKDREKALENILKLMKS